MKYLTYLFFGSPVLGTHGRILARVNKFEHGVQRLCRARNFKQLARRTA